MHTLNLISDQNPSDDDILKLHDGYLTDLVRAIKLGTVPSRGKFHQAVGLESAPLSSPATRHLYEDVEIVISATDGAHNIAQAKHVFAGYIDPDFVNWGLDEVGEATPATRAQVEEITQSGTFRGIVETFGVHPDRLCLTQHQIIQFCLEHSDKLRTHGYGTFFLFRGKTRRSKFYVVRVGLSRTGHLVARVEQLYDGQFWPAEHRHRFVFPQLNALQSTK